MNAKAMAHAVSLFLLVSTLVTQGTAHAERTCNGELCQAISAALAEILNTDSPNVPVDLAYEQILSDFFLATDPQFLPEPGACDRVDHPYPEVTEGSLLHRVLQKQSMRVLWVPEAIPFSFIDDKKPAGVSLAMWPLITERLAEHYGVNLHFKLVQSPGIAVNDQHMALATPDDPKCKLRVPADPELVSKKQIRKACSEVIGGGYAVNPPRAELNDFTCTYMPLTMNAVRTRVGLAAAFDDLDLDQILVNQIRARVSADSPVTIAAIRNSAEVDFVRFNFANVFLDPSSGLLPGITLVERDGTENIYEYADRQDEPGADGAHFVLGQIARLTYFRSPEITDPAICTEAGDDCKIVLMNPFAIEGVSFGTYKLAN